MSRKFAGLFVAVLLGALLLPVLPAGATGLPDLQCGVNPTTSVRLRHDLTCATPFLLDAPVHPGAPAVAITIDLGGHTLSFSPQPTGPCALIIFPGCAIQSQGAVALTLRNGTVVGQVGLAETIPGALGGAISHVHVVGGVSLAGPSQPQLDHSWVDGEVSQSSAGGVIDHNVITGGVFSDVDTGVSFTVTHNWITNRGADPLNRAGIGMLSQFSAPDMSGLIADNFIAGAVGAGIAVDLSGASGLMVARNLLVANKGDGITAASEPGFPRGGSTTFTGNLAIGNGGHGINVNVLAPDTVTDGGGNHAFANRTPPQCVGLRC